MDKSQLKDALDDALDVFQGMISSRYKENSEEPATHGDIVELSRQTIYLLSEFEDALLEYLEQ